VSGESLIRCSIISPHMCKDYLTAVKFEAPLILLMRTANINLTPDKMVNIFRAGANLKETPNIPVRPSKNVRFNEHPASLPSPLPFLPLLFNIKSTLLLNGYGEAQVYYIQRWRHHSESGDKYASRASEKN